MQHIQAPAEPGNRAFDFSFTGKLLWDIRHWFTPQTMRPWPLDTCVCLICNLKRLGPWFIFTNLHSILRVAYHQYQVSRSLESCACARRNPPPCLLAEGYAVPLALPESSLRLCRICAALGADPTSARAIASKYGHVIATSKRHIQRAAHAGCPLCRIVLDRLIGNHGDLVQSLWALPFCGSIWLGFRAVARPGSWPSYTDDRQRFNVLEVSLLKPTERPSSWSVDLEALEPTRLELFAVAAEPGDPATEDIPSRPPVTDVGSEEAIAQAEMWIKTCAEEHEECLPKPSEGPLPGRLVDVGEGGVRLCEGQGWTGRYVALSYCWGQPYQPVMTKMDNIQTFRDQGLPENQLPQTILDAVQVTRRLGIGYLWVDVLCIIQDSRVDKDREIGRLQDYFANAYVTIIAANAPSCNSGFLQPRKSTRAQFESRMTPERAPPAFKLPWVCRDGRIGNLLLQPWKEYDFMAEAVNSRAWTLEERLLSPRMLVYTSTQLMWMCQTGVRTPEVNTSGFIEKGFGRLPDNVFTAGATTEIVQQRTADDISDMLRVWRIIVDDYTARTLTRSADKLRAISGIAARMKAAAPEMTYLAGIWHSAEHSEREAAWELIWRISSGQELAIDTEDEAIRRPSFTWSSVEVPVVWGMNFKFKNFVRPTPCVQVLDAQFDLRKPHQIFGFIDKATILLKGPVKNVTGRRKNGAKFYLVPDQSDFVGDLDTTIIEETEEKYFVLSDGSRRTYIALKTREEEVPARLLKLHRSGGLILRNVGDGEYCRIGTFEMQSETEVADWLSSFTTEITRLV